jgi:hypothetical protein
MQALQDEGREGPGPAPAGGAEGLDQDSNRVELLCSGFSGARGWCRNITIDYKRRVDCITYTRIRISELVLAPADAVLVLQGRLIKDLFLPNAFFRLRENVLARGPFIYLAGELAAMHDPPPRLKNVILATDVSVETMKLTSIDVLTVLVQDMQK